MAAGQPKMSGQECQECQLCQTFMLVPPGYQASSSQQLPAGPHTRCRRQSGACALRSNRRFLGAYCGQLQSAGLAGLGDGSLGYCQ
jgi:hypothetical protein